MKSNYDRSSQGFTSESEFVKKENQKERRRLRRIRKIKRRFREYEEEYIKKPNRFYYDEE